MDIKDIKVFSDNWNDMDTDERVRVLLEDHCYCSDIKPVSLSEEFAEYEVTPPRNNNSLRTFFDNLKDIASNINIKLLDGERIHIGIWFFELTFEAKSDK